MRRTNEYNTIAATRTDGRRPLSSFVFVNQELYVGNELSDIVLTSARKSNVELLVWTYIRAVGGWEVSQNILTWRMHSSIIEREVGIEVKMTLEAGDDNTRGGSVYNTECCDG